MSMSCHDGAPATATAAAATPAAVSAAWSMDADGQHGAGLSPSMASALTLQPKTMHLVEHLLAQGASHAASHHAAPNPNPNPNYDIIATFL